MTERQNVSIATPAGRASRGNRAVATQDRIKLDHTPMDMMLALCEGNPGALSVCMDIQKANGGDVIGLCADLIYLDAAGIYGSDIWIAFKDYCGQDIRAFIDRLRSGELRDDFAAIETTSPTSQENG